MLAEPETSTVSTLSPLEDISVVRDIDGGTFEVGVSHDEDHHFSNNTFFEIRGISALTGADLQEYFKKICIAKLTKLIREFREHATGRRNMHKTLCTGEGCSAELSPEDRVNLCQSFECYARKSARAIDLERCHTNRHKHREQMWFCCQCKSGEYDMPLTRIYYYQNHHKSDMGSTKGMPLSTDGQEPNWHTWCQDRSYNGCGIWWLSAKANVALNSGSARGMGEIFLQLKESMDLHRPSVVMKRVMNVIIHHIPPVVENILQHVPDGVMFAGFATATAIFTDIAFAGLQEPRIECQSSSVPSWLGGGSCSG
ncbi:hypothetical protein BDZ45DRAFT_745464 [Acephala macrosclerotiorum]|nr:hypothetical protein BDZ45DRAFT_745464 [Acephala macrosclerotiorum]